MLNARDKSGAVLNPEPEYEKSFFFSFCCNGKYSKGRRGGLQMCESHPAILSHLIVLSALCTFSTSEQKETFFFFLSVQIRNECVDVSVNCVIFGWTFFPLLRSFSSSGKMSFSGWLCCIENIFYSCLISEHGVALVLVEGKMLRHEKWKIRSILCGYKFNSHATGRHHPKKTN